MEFDESFYDKTKLSMRQKGGYIYLGIEGEPKIIEQQFMSFENYGACNFEKFNSKLNWKYEKKGYFRTTKEKIKLAMRTPWLLKFLDDGMNEYEAKIRANKKAKERFDKIEIESV
tara:strand:+ start:58867 stop:59211 length:345 start_codon:yes stop_codon:yes gene_type:complete